MWLQIIILSIVQGLTEFLPVSSSGHLVILQSIFGLKEFLFYDILLHFATFLAVILFYYKKIFLYFRKTKIVFLILLLTVPTGIIGLIVKKKFIFIYDNFFYASVCLVITGFLLFIAEKRYSVNLQNRDLDNMTVYDALLVGIAQGIAVLPGISRSGATLSTMLFLNFKKEQSVEFIFIAAIPAILAATLLELKDTLSFTSFDFVYTFGMSVAFFLAVFSLKFLTNIVKSMKIHYFAYYCWFVGFLGILLFFIKK